MMPEHPTLPTACTQASEALERDPLQLPALVEAHLRTCLSCSEARVFLLAMVDDPPVDVPQGYFEGLGYRILRKLPARRAAINRTTGMWLAAAALMAALGLGATGFFMGQATRAPLVEAAQPRGVADTLDPSAETPFLEAEDPVNQLSELSPREAETALERLQAAPSAATGPLPAKNEP